MYTYLLPSLFMEKLIRDLLETVPDKKVCVQVSWVKDLPDMGNGVDHFVVAFMKDKERYSDTVVVKDGVKPQWGDSVCISANTGTHPFIEQCKECESCSSCTDGASEPAAQ